MQYVEFLTQALGPEYGSLLPSLGDLCNSYGLEPSIAFHILRPMLYELVTVSTLTARSTRNLSQLGTEI